MTILTRNEAAQEELDLARMDLTVCERHYWDLYALVGKSFSHPVEQMDNMKELGNDAHNLDRARRLVAWCENNVAMLLTGER